MQHFISWKAQIGDKSFKMLDLKVNVFSHFSQKQTPHVQKIYIHTYIYIYLNELRCVPLASQQAPGETAIS